MYQAVKEAALKYPRDLALYYKGKKISFASLIKRIDETADILVNVLNIKENDIVTISQPNIPSVVVLFYAVNKIGAIANLLHPLTPFNQVKSIMDRTNSKAAFIFEQRVGKEVNKYQEIAHKIYVTRIEDDLPKNKKFCYHTFVNYHIRKKLAKTDDFMGFKYFYQLKPTGKEVNEVSADKDKCSVLLHSGSTTDKPKTICLNEHAFNYIVSHTDTFLSLSKEQLRGQKMLSVLPSFHGFGLCMTMHTPLANGFACVLIPKFKADVVTKTLDEIKFTCMCGVPTIYKKLLDEPKFVNSKNLKHLRCAFCGGDYLSPELLNEFNQTMEKAGSSCRLFQGYGLTEAVAANAVNTFLAYKDGSLGKPIPGAIFKIVDPEGKELPRGEIGEIIFKSEAMMLSYYQDQNSTETCLINGYIHTGDLGYMDDDDFIYFKQRQKRVIKISGVPVFPSEVEQLIESLPEVTSCAAISIPDAKLQYSLKVIVVAKYYDETALKDKIFETCRKYLLTWSVPTEIEFRKELPLTPLGKVDFKALQEEENKKHSL